MKKKTAVWIAAALVLATVIAVALFWETILICIAPKAVLTASLTDTVSQLKERFSSGPMPVLMRGLDPEGKNTIALQLEKDHPLLGQVQYDMDVQTEQNPRRILASGQASFWKTALSLSVYLDGQFAALSAPELLQGRYYGLSYDSFAEDIAQSSVLWLLVDEQKLRQWENTISQLQAVMNREYSVPDLSQLDIQSVILGLMALDTEVDREVLSLRGENMNCAVVSIETNGKEILDGLEYLKAELPISISPSDEITLSFWLHDGAVLKGEIEIDSDPQETEIAFLIGQNPYSDPLELLIQNAKGYSEVRIETESDEIQYRETVYIRKAWQNQPEALQLHYTWNRASGEMTLSVTEDERNCENTFILLPDEQGFSVQTQDFEGFMHMLIGTEDTGNSSCAMTVKRGAEVSVPEYIPFAEWSMDDLLTLIGGLGNLFGLKTS